MKKTLEKIISKTGKAVAASVLAGSLLTGGNAKAEDADHVKKEAPFEQDIDYFKRYDTDLSLSFGLASIPQNGQADGLVNKTHFSLVGFGDSFIAGGALSYGKTDFDLPRNQGVKQSLSGTDFDLQLIGLWRPTEAFSFGGDVLFNLDNRDVDGSLAHESDEYTANLGLRAQYILPNFRAHASYHPSMLGIGKFNEKFVAPGAVSKDDGRKSRDAAELKVVYQPDEDTRLWLESTVTYQGTKFSRSGSPDSRSGLWHAGVEVYGQPLSGLVDNLNAGVGLFVEPAVHATNYWGPGAAVSKWWSLGEGDSKVGTKVSVIYKIAGNDRHDARNQVMVPFVLEYQW